MKKPLSTDAQITLVETTDIGGTFVASPWVPMKDVANILAYVEIGTWNATDDLDECRLEQGQGAAGSNPKDLTTDAAAGDYDTANPVDADGNFVILEAKAEDLDTENGYDHVRLYLAEGGNTGVDNVTAFLIRYNNAHQYKERNGAAVVGEKVYVTPS